MTVGLPGVGIGGIFYLISALLMPLHELVFLARGRSSLRRWRTIATQWTQAAGIVAALWGTGWALAQIVPQPAAVAGAAALPTIGHNVIRTASVSLSLGTLILVLLGVQIARLLVGPQRRRPRFQDLPIPVPRPSRTSGPYSQAPRPAADTNDHRRNGAPLRRKSIGRSPEVE